MVSILERLVFIPFNGATRKLCVHLLCCWTLISEGRRMMRRCVSTAVTQRTLLVFSMSRRVLGGFPHCCALRCIAAASSVDASGDLDGGAELDDLDMMNAAMVDDDAKENDASVPHFEAPHDVEPHEAINPEAPHKPHEPLVRQVPPTDEPPSRKVLNNQLDCRRAYTFDDVMQTTFDFCRDENVDAETKKSSLQKTMRRWRELPHRWGHCVALLCGALASGISVGPSHSALWSPLFVDALFVCRKAQSWQKAETLVDLAVDARIPSLNPFLFKRVVAAAARVFAVTGKFSICLRILESQFCTTRRDGDGSLREHLPNLRFFTHMIEAAARAKEVDAALLTFDVYRELVRELRSTTAATPSNPPRGCNKQEDASVDKAYVVVGRALLEEGRVAECLRHCDETCAADGIRLSLPLRCLRVQCMGLLGRVDEALRIEFPSGDAPADILHVPFTLRRCLFELLGRKGDWKQMCTWVDALGVKAHPSEISLTMRACKEAKEFALGLDLFRRLPTLNGPSLGRNSTEARRRTVQRLLHAGFNTCFLELCEICVECPAAVDQAAAVYAPDGYQKETLPAFLKMLCDVGRSTSCHAVFQRARDSEEENFTRLLHSWRNTQGPRGVVRPPPAHTRANFSTLLLPCAAHNVVIHACLQSGKFALAQQSLGVIVSRVQRYKRSGGSSVDPLDDEPRGGRDVLRSEKEEEDVAETLANDLFEEQLFLEESRFAQQCGGHINAESEYWGYWEGVIRDEATPLVDAMREAAAATSKAVTPTARKDDDR